MERIKRATLFRLALLSFIAVTLHNAAAGSAVALGTNGHLVYSYGRTRSEQVARQRALDICRRNGGLDPKILASTDVVGEGTIAVGRKGNLWIYGVSLGRPSALDAENRAMEQCRRRGGIDPKIKWGFRG
jgi:hypothetical protein